jgi:hypothetical protein
MSGTLVSDRNFDRIIEEKEYYDHLAFQASFSTSHLITANSMYTSFILDGDGLPVPENTDIVENINFDDFPPFPLLHLMDFLTGVNSGRKEIPQNLPLGVSKTENIMIISKFSPIIPVIFILPGLFLIGKIPQKDHLSGLKKITNKKRLRDIDRKKNPVYNNKNNIQVRRDA